MKYFLLFLAFVFAMPSQAAISTTAKSYPCNQKFLHVVYLDGAAGKGALTGENAANALPFVDGDLWAIPANTLIQDVYWSVDTVITGTTVLEVGDDDDADGFIKDAAAGFGTTGLKVHNAAVAGAYLFVETAGATDPADVYRVPASKFYAAAGKEVKLNITTTNTAGKARVFIEGVRICSN